jgi:hypothetical protein
MADKPKYYWYHFTKTHYGRTPVAETYRQYHEDTPTGDIHDECEEWADEVNYAGNHTSFTYEYTKVDRPPKEYIIKKLKECQDNIKREKKNLIFWKTMLPREVKIENIIDEL